MNVTDSTQPTTKLYETKDSRIKSTNTQKLEDRTEDGWQVS